MRRCSALRRPTCSELVCTCKFHECGGGGIRPVLFLQSVRNSACTVEGRIATRTASVPERAAQIGIARRAGHACRSSCTRVTTTLESLRTVRGARAAEFASAYAALRLQLDLRRSSRCARLHANAMEYAQKPSQRLGQRGCKFDSHGVISLRQRLHGGAHACHARGAGAHPNICGRCATWTIGRYLGGQPSCLRSVAGWMPGHSVDGLRPGTLNKPDRTELT